MRSWSGSRSCSANTSGSTSRHRRLSEVFEVVRARNEPSILGDHLGIFERRSARHLFIYQQRCLTEFRRQLPEEVHAGYQATLPDIGLVHVAAVEAEVGNDELAFDARHKEQS